MGNVTAIQLDGWVSGPDDRGTVDILWSCGVTILLCCWVSVYPNVGSVSDKWYHPFLDKLNLFCIALLGPDFLFAIAWGQWSKAQASIQLFKKQPLSTEVIELRYVHAFFINAGGIHLKSPDFPGGFPIDAPQLHYLITNGFVERPNLESMAIDERNSADSLSRVITIFQAFWFGAGIVERACTGLSMTTMELTTSSFVLVMLATSAAWYHKPSITKPRYISTKNLQSVQTIRDFSQANTHPMLPSKWYQTPLEYINQEHFGINLHWSYYTRLGHMLHIRLFSRPVTARPWDRFPSDTWLCPTFAWSIPISCLTVLFSLLFIAAWNFHFPSKAEKILWRICSVYHAAFSIYGAVYYGIEMMKTKKRPSHSSHSRKHLRPVEERMHLVSTDGASRDIPLITRFLDKWHSTLPVQDPEARTPLRVLLPVTVTCAVYAICRIFIYVEDFISLRQQPSDVYTSASILSWVF